MSVPPPINGLRVPPLNAGESPRPFKCLAKLWWTRQTLLPKGCSNGSCLPWVIPPDCNVISIMPLLHWAQNRKKGNLSMWWLKAQRTQQAQNGLNFDFQVKFNLEEQGQSTSKTIGISTVMRCIYNTNFEIKAWFVGELSCRQTQNQVKFNV